MKKKFVIVDINRKKKLNPIANVDIDSNCEVLSLSVYSNYLLDASLIEYRNFHDYVSEKQYLSDVIELYDEILELFVDSPSFCFLFYELSLLVTKYKYFECLKSIMEDYKVKGYEVCLVSDARYSVSYLKNEQTLSSLLDLSSFIDDDDEFFYRKNKLKFSCSLFGYKNVKKLFSKTFTPSDFNFYKYGNLKIKKNIKKACIFERELSEDRVFKNHKELTLQYEKLLVKIEEKFGSNSVYSSISHDIFSIVSKSAPEKINFQSDVVYPFTYIHKEVDYQEILRHRVKGLPVVISQHGSYVDDYSMQLKLSEINPADINLVCNEYTKEYFESQGAKSVHVVGNILFEPEVESKKLKYDCLYLIYCSGYSSDAGCVLGLEYLSPQNYSDLFKRHQAVIELFGEKYTEKTLCIKIKSSIMLSGAYVPFIELVKKYKNISIEFIEPIEKLISVSGCILSDYYSSNFITRDMHIKKDVILFSGIPCQFPVDIKNDLEKMFVFIENVSELDYVVSNMKDVFEKRVRDIDLIEKYSSPVVSEKLLNDTLNTAYSDFFKSND